MICKPNWDKVRDRYREYWARENHDRPILHITAPKERRVIRKLPEHGTLRERWFDVEYMLAKAHLGFQNTYFGAEAFPILNPDLGPDLFAALYGVPLEYGEDTSWALHNLEEWPENPAFHMDKAGVYYRKIIEMTEAAVEDGRDQYFVGVTDIHPGMDALVSMRGPENLCIDALECPELLREASLNLFAGFKELFGELCAITGRYQEGSSNWMRVWHPGRWYVTSCDFCCLVSPAMFEDLVVEELEAELAWLDASIFHLDGPDALGHLDRLLAIPELGGIQWVYGAGQPTAAHWIDVLRRIQAAGKTFQVNAEPEELPILLENLAPEGAMYVVEAKSEEDARALEKLAKVENK